MRATILAIKTLLNHTLGEDRGEQDGDHPARVRSGGRRLHSPDVEFDKFLAHKTTIVCADDDATALARVRTMLIGAGFEGVPISDLSTALERVCECLPHLIIVDPTMGSMRGFEFCRQLRSHPETSHIPIVLHTAAPVPAEAGLYDCICTKPVEPSALRLVVRTLLMVRP